MKINKTLIFLLLTIFIPFDNLVSNQLIFDDSDKFRKINRDYISEFTIPNKLEKKWENIFKNKTYEQIISFLNNLPVQNTDEVIQNLIFEILISKKSFDRKLVKKEQDEIIFENLINKLFETARLSEIELIYSQAVDLENNNFILKKMIEGNLLRNRHTEACKILNKVNQDPLYFGKIMIICNIINNKFDEAKLGLQLLKEQNQPGDIFFIDLAFSLMSESDISQSSDLKKNLEKVQELNPIIMSSLQFADISPNFDQIEKLSTSGLLFILSNPSVDTDLKIFCSEILVKQGRINVEMLSEAYLLARFDSKEIENAEKIYKTLSPIRARPLLYQSIIRDNKPESRFRKIVALIKISINDNLLPKISYLISELVDFEEYINNFEDSILISKMYQSRQQYQNARIALNKFYKNPESDYRGLAIDISEYLKNNNFDNFSIENYLEKISNIKEDRSVFIKKALIVLIGNFNLNQSVIDKLMKIPLDSNIKASDIGDFSLATKLSFEKDYFNSLKILFRIVGQKDLMQLNLIQIYTVLTILKNLGLDEQLKKISERILI